MEVVACAVTFGTVIAQLGVATIKLKNLWDEVAGVPEKIKELLEEMELFRMLFAEMETSIMDPAYPNLPLSFWTGHLMQLSLNRAKRALTALETVTKELDDRLKTKRNGLKRTIVAIRGLMNKEKIQSLENRLKKAVKLLWMSYDLSSRHLQEERLRRHVTRTIRTEMAITVTTQQPASLQLQSSPSSDEPPDNDTRKVARNLAKAQTRTMFRWRLPSWWSTTVWEICSAPQPGWSYGLRVYNVVPNDSPIIRSIDSCDAAGVTKLFRSRLASPFDRDENNWSLLQRAVFKPSNHDTSTIEALLEWTPSEVISDSTAGLKSPLEWVSVASIITPDQSPIIREILQLFWPLNHDVDEFWDSYDSGSRLPNESLPAYHTTSTQWKCQLIRQEVILNFPSSQVDTTWISTDGPVQPIHVAISVDNNFSLVHSAAARLATEVSHAGSGDYDELINDTFTQEIIEASTLEDLHHLESVRSEYIFSADFPPVTPLICLISSIPWTLVGLAQHNRTPRKVASFSSPDSLHHAIRRALLNWVHNLRCAGVDLIDYGRKERSLLHDNGGLLRGVCDADSDAWTEWCEDGYDELMQLLPMWLIDLTYGAEPGEWDLIFVIEFEAMARDFWELIEEQAFTGMPGSWVE